MPTELGSRRKTKIMTFTTVRVRSATRADGGTRTATVPTSTGAISGENTGRDTMIV